MDDDIASIQELKFVNKTGKPMLRKIENMEALIADAYSRLEESKLSMCGFYPCANPFFMKRLVTEDLTFCIGALKMFFNRRACENREFTLLEDYETSMKYYLRDNGILRYNYITINHNYNAEKWNLTLEDKKYEIELFKQKYSDYVFTKKKLLVWIFSLKRKFLIIYYLHYG
jgi:hypothetical protein